MKLWPFAPTAAVELLPPRKCPKCFVRRGLLSADRYCHLDGSLLVPAPELLCCGQELRSDYCPRCGKPNPEDTP